MEDVSSWEAELREEPLQSSTPTIQPSSTPTLTDIQPHDDLDVVDDDELAALYDQYVEAQEQDVPDSLDGITEDILDELFSGKDDL